MAQRAIGNTPATLYLQCNQRNGDKVYACAVKDEITVTREPNVAAKLTATILRDELTPEVGDFVKLVVDEDVIAQTGHFVFYGFIFDTEKHDEWCSITAYDQLIYLARSKTRLVTNDATIGGLVMKIAEDNNLAIANPPIIHDSEYRFPYRIEDNVTFLQIIQNAIDIVHKNTGEKFFLWDDCGAIALTNQGFLAGDVSTIISAQFLESYSITESASEEFYTSVRIDKIISQDQDGKAGERETTTFTYDDMRAKFGILEYYGTVNKDDNAEAEAKSILDTHSHLKRGLSLTGCQGDVSVRGGTPVLVDFFTKDRKEYVRGWYETKSVVHHFKHQHHTMDIECELIKPYHTWEQDQLDNAYLGQSDLLGYW